ncbi:MAG: DUF2793 domain-containing protein [Paracoccaceae bacterium]|nr:DUF2793 domain-containing protein [Paracoccaceae bacterium]MDG2259858.1 DUF2793 domain-containing protein [Paracoccaceae bacterium]
MSLKQSVAIAGYQDHEMSENSPRLDLPYIQAAQAQKHITHNEAIERLDALTQLVVSEFDASGPPGVPINGETFALGASPTGAWASHPNEIAFWTGSGWLFIAPQTGWQACRASDQDLRIWDGANWMAAIPSIETAEMLGVNTTADTTNRLSVSSQATLLNNAGGGHQLKINKSGSTETASLLFQSGWTGHAEMGLAGDINFSLKVSPNGGGWYSAFQVDPVNQSIEFSPAGVTTVKATSSVLQVDAMITGDAVQSSSVDTTAGKLMPVGAFGLGAPGAYLADIDVTDNSIAPGLYNLNSLTTGAPRSTGQQHLLHSRRSSGGGETQLAMVEDDGSLFIRTRASGAWQGWQQVASSDHYTGDMTNSETAPIFERGTSASGDYTRLADGTQFCWHEVPLSYIWARELYGIWNFPASFISPAKVFCSVEFYSLLTNATPDVDAISTATVEGASATSAQFRLMRAAGQTDFVSSDTANVSVLAFGRWK